MLVSGKYYYSEYNGCTYMFKYKETIDTKICCFYYVYKGVYIIPTNFLCYVDDSLFKEIEFSDILNYLPENHPDVVTYNRKKKIKHLFR